MIDDLKQGLVGKSLVQIKSPTVYINPENPYEFADEPGIPKCTKSMHVSTYCGSSIDSLLSQVNMEEGKIFFMHSHKTARMGGVDKIMMRGFCA